MNKKIQELAEQARKHFPKTETSGEFWIFDEQKFAELIIQESVDFLSQAACDYEAEMLRSFWDES